MRELPMSANATPANVIAGILLAAVALPTPATASEWGCEVLLCASSSNPSWRGVPACHPPMNRLISAMKKPGFDWPICPEGGTREPGYQRYAECPEGYQVGSSRDRNGFAREGDLCVRQSTFARTIRTVSTTLIGSGAAYKRSPCLDRSGQSLTSSTSRMTPLAKPSGIGSSCTNNRISAVKEGLNPCGLSTDTPCSATSATS